MAERIAEIRPSQPELFAFTDPITSSEKFPPNNITATRVSMYDLHLQTKRLSAAENGNNWEDCFQPTKEAVDRAIRSSTGSFLDLAYVSLVRHWFIIQNRYSDKYRLTKACHGMQPHERAIMEAIADPVIQAHRGVGLQAIPSMVDDMYKNWQQALVYGKKKTQAPVKATTPGTLWNEEVVRDKVQKTKEFARKLRQIYQERVDSYGDHDTLANHQHFGEAEPAVAPNLFANQAIYLPIIFPEGFSLQYVVHIDYMFSQAVPDSSPQIIIIQRKFQYSDKPAPDSQVDQIHKLLTAAAARLFLTNNADRRRYNNPYQPAIHFEELDTEGVVLLDKRYITKTAEPNYSYKNITLDADEIEDTASLLQFFAQDWMEHKELYLAAKRTRKDAFVPPYIPRSPKHHFLQPEVKIT